MKMRHCFWCGEEIGEMAYTDQYGTCGKRECDSITQVVRRAIVEGIGLRAVIEEIGQKKR